MNWLTGIITYVAVWWLSLVAVLPLWVRPSDPGDPGHAVGAPAHPMIGRKLALATVIAAIIWIGIDIVIKESWFSFRGS